MTTTWQEGIPDIPCNCENCNPAASAGYALKAKFSEPCTSCGYCCQSELCQPAQVLFEKENCVQPPCPALVEQSGKFLCGLVLGEQAVFSAERHLVSKSLGVGCGCSCPDADTTEEEIEAHDQRSRQKLFGDCA